MLNSAKESDKQSEGMVSFGNEMKSSSHKAYAYTPDEAEMIRNFDGTVSFSKIDKGDRYD